MNLNAKTLTILMGTTSLFANAGAALAQNGKADPTQIAQMRAQTQEIPEQILITGSLIRGTAAVGAPVTELGAQDFSETGVVSIDDLLTKLPVFVDYSAPTAASVAFSYFIDSINIHGLTGGGGYTRTLMLIDGMKLAPQGTGAIQYDPSIIPSVALERVDVLADGASATYGSDAIAGVVNVILKRGFDGAIVQAVVGSDYKGGFNWTASGLYGQTWDSGDVAISFERGIRQPLNASTRSYYTQNFTPWGLNNDTPIFSASPAIISVGPPNAVNGTGCTNCYSVPTGQNGVGLTWAQLQAHPGTGNEINPDTYQTIISADQHVSSTITFDQYIVPGIQFNAESYYSNRRDQSTQGAIGLTTVAIPTTNPYYPVGAPAGLVASLSFPQPLNTESSEEISARYSGGFTIDLPADWQGKLFGSISSEVVNRLNPANVKLVGANNVNAALGATIAATAASNANPGIPAWTKPASVPYLNPFCDPNAFSCIDPATLAYIETFTTNNSVYILHEAGLNFDGPVFTLPGGTVRAAIGGNYETENFSINTVTDPITSAVQVFTPDHLGRTVTAGFGQLNVPIFGGAFTLPLVQKLEVEISDRYDHYSDFGGTNNPRISADWTVTDGFMLRGSWGTNFVAPSFKSLSGVLARNIAPRNFPGNPSLAACTVVGGTPVPGSAAASLNPTCSAANQFPLGIQIGSGGIGGLAGVLRPAGYTLQPEKSKDWSVGFDYAPTNFLKGLDVNLAWYRVDITGAIALLGSNIGLGLNDPTTAFTYILRGDPRFNAALAFALASPLGASNLAGVDPTKVQFIVDGSFRNTGSKDQEGVDFNARYDWDMGNFGSWNTGISGTYTTHDVSTLVPGATPVDAFNTAGQQLETRLRYRARLGWSENGYSITAFMDYQSHLFSTVALPPTSYLALYPNYATTGNLVPAQYLFDLSLGYGTGNTPNNDYLKQINVFLTVNNIMNRNPPFQYGGTGLAYAYYSGNTNPYGRYWRIGITKEF